MSDEDERPPCEYNYHDDSHPDVCLFECMVDEYLLLDDELTIDAQEYRESIIKGIERIDFKLRMYRRKEARGKIIKGGEYAHSCTGKKCVVVGFTGDDVCMLDAGKTAGYETYIRHSEFLRKWVIENE